MFDRIRQSFWTRQLVRWLIKDTDWVLRRKDSIGVNRLNDYAKWCHGSSVKGGWWHDLTTGKPLNRNKGEMLMLIVTELSEAMEGERKNIMDDKLPHRKMAEVELADSLIRIFDYAGGHNYDLEGALHEKMAFNAERADHKPENRIKAGGKAF